VVVDPTGQRWGIEIDAPGSLRGGGWSTGAGFLAAVFGGAFGGWRVAVYRLNQRDRWQGPVSTQKAVDESDAERSAEAIARSIEDGSWDHLTSAG